MKNYRCRVRVRYDGSSHLSQETLAGFITAAHGLDALAEWTTRIRTFGPDVEVSGIQVFEIDSDGQEVGYDT